MDLVQVDAEWVLRFNAILDLLRRVLGIAAVLLGAGVLAVIGNTIRLEIQGRRTEIEVVRLVGGSTGFVRRPFLYAGMLYGLWGALLAWAMVGAAVLVLRRRWRLWPSSTAAAIPWAVRSCGQVGTVLRRWTGPWLAGRLVGGGPPPARH